MPNWLENYGPWALASVGAFLTWLVRIAFTNQKKIGVIEEHMNAADKRQEDLKVRLCNHAKETKEELHIIRADIKTILDKK